MDEHESLCVGMMCHLVWHCEQLNVEGWQTVPYVYTHTVESVLMLASIVPHV